MRSLVVLILLAMLSAAGTAQSPAHAQALPYHGDPSGRELTLSPGQVPAIRFLTTPDFPPFNYRDVAGELVGFNIDLSRSICSELAVACTIQAWPWEQAANALADKHGDALIAGLALDDSNGKKFDFSSIYLAFPGRFVTRVEAVAGFDPARLADQPVAVRRDSAHARFIGHYLPRLLVEPFDTESEALEAVADGQASAYFGDGLRASFWINQQGECCAFAGTPYFRPDLFGEGLAIAVPAGHDNVRVILDEALIRLKQKGVLDELYLRWFPIGFY